MTRPVRVTASTSGTSVDVHGVNVHAQRAFDGPTDAFVTALRRSYQHGAKRELGFPQHPGW